MSTCTPTVIRQFSSDNQDFVLSENINTIRCYVGLLASEAKGRGFDPRQPHHSFPPTKLKDRKSVTAER